MAKTKRRGLDIGRGRGYRNILTSDSKVHRESAGGKKQPQMVTDIDTFVAKMEQAKQKKVEPEAKETPFRTTPEPKVTEIKATETKKAGFFGSLASKTGAFVAKEARYGYAKGKEYLAEQEKKREAKHIEELAEIKHPMVDQREKAQENIVNVEKQIELNEDPQREEKLFQQLEEHKKQLADIDYNLKHLDLSILSNEQLKSLAVRHKEEGSFSMSGMNKYEAELYRRIKKAREIDMKVAEAQTKPLNQQSSGGGFFAEFFNPPPSTSKSSIFDELLGEPKK